MNTRDFVHVDDVCRAIIKSLNLNGLNILNIGSSKDIKIITVAKLISKELKSKKKIILSMQNYLIILLFRYEIQITNRHF